MIENLKFVEDNFRKIYENSLKKTFSDSLFISQIYTHKCDLSISKIDPIYEI